MTTLELYTNETLELVIDNNTGEIFASLKSMVSLTCTDTKTINKYVNGGLMGVDQMELKHDEFHTPDGIKAGALLNEFQIIETLRVYNSSLVADIAMDGIRAFFHPLVGYKPNSMIVPPTTTTSVSKHTAVEYFNASSQLDKITNKTLRDLLTDVLIKELNQLQGKY